MRAHVWGYLDKVNFKEGDLVKKGDVLFELDPRPYQALLDQAKGKVAQEEAQLKFDEAEYQRNVRLVRTGAVTASQFDKTTAARDVDIANIAADKALVASRQLDLGYTKVIAPVSGRVSRYIVTVGNLIQSGDQFGGTLLTTIESVDPMYAYFDVDEYSACCASGNWPARASRTRPATTATPSRWGWRTRTGFLTRGRSILSTTGFVRRRAPSGCGAYSPIKSRFSCRGCSWHPDSHRPTAQRRSGR